MANPEHLEILERGVEAWNRWRKENPEIMPDLEWADLKGESLRGGINFYQANLRWAKFNGASLSGADFNEADLEHTSFNKAYLSETNFENTNLSGANLSGANLSGANLSGANLKNADLSAANLAGADLNHAKLYNADLSAVNLAGANLSHAVLTNTCFKAANLNTADFSEADLFQANLSESKSLSTKFEEAHLTEANITNWCINEETNFKNVICDYICIYKNHNLYEWRLEQQRYPQNGEIFEPGDFEDFVRKLQRLAEHNSEKKATVNQEPINLNFNQGIDWNAFLNSYKDLEVKAGEDSIPIKDIELKEDGTVIICIQSPPGYEQDSVIKFIQEQYQQQFKHIDKVSNQERRDKEREIEEYKRHNIDLLEIIKNQAQQQIHLNQEQNFNINNYDNSTHEFQNIWGDGNQVVKGNGNNFVEGNDNTIGSSVPSTSELQQNSISEILFSIIKSRIVGWLLYMILVLSAIALIIWLPIVISHQSTPKQAETEV